MNDVIFDIETGPLSSEEVLAFTDEYPAFDLESVKFGNTRDPVKKAEKIEADEAKHKADEAAYYANAINRAALSPLTGKVLAIGMVVDGETRILCSGDEAEDIAAFWKTIAPHGAITHKVIGFNSNRFDIPFLARRSWKLGIDMPHTLFRGRYINERCIDLMDLWKCGDYQATIKLDHLARFLGCGAKTGSGADFARLYEEDRDAAIAYLENDIRMTYDCAVRMGVVHDRDPAAAY